MYAGVGSTGMATMHPSAWAAELYVKVQPLPLRTAALQQKRWTRERMLEAFLHHARLALAIQDMKQGPGEPPPDADARLGDPLYQRGLVGNIAAINGSMRLNMAVQTCQGQERRHAVWAAAARAPEADGGPPADPVLAQSPQCALVGALQLLNCGRCSALHVAAALHAHTTSHLSKGGGLNPSLTSGLWSITEP